MAIILNDNLKILVGAPIDDKYLNSSNQPYATISAVTNTIGIAQRYIGLTVNIANEEYWFKTGVADINLIEKLVSASGGTAISGIQNIGTGTGEIYSGLSGTTAELRKITGSGDTVVTTSGADIIIFSQATGNTQPIYTGASPSNIDAGGMTSGTTLTGKTLSELIEDIATTVYTPTLVNPSSNFTDDQTAIKEVGVILGSINFTAIFDRGLISPAYGTSGFRSGLPTTYNYTGTGLPASEASTGLTNLQNITNYMVLLGANIWTNSVNYSVGEQPKDSAGGNFGSPLPAGVTSADSNTITGIYPWFYGTVTSASRPVANQALIDSGDPNKQVTQSTTAISVGNFNAVGQWIWFAIPNTSTSKAVWDGSNSPSNTGAIGGVVSAGGNLFPDPDVVSVDSPTALWTGVNYKIYISNFQTSTYDSGTPYTLTFKNS